MFGIDGVLLALIITFIILFGSILSGFPVAFAIGGAGVLSFVVVALLDSGGLLTHSLVDVTSPEYRELLNEWKTRTYNLAFLTLDRNIKCGVSSVCVWKLRFKSGDSERG